VGTLVGASVGTRVGASVGTRVGASVGVWVGAVVGVWEQGRERDNGQRTGCAVRVRASHLGDPH
jgi:outer membrane lipoprotein SlyB